MKRTILSALVLLFLGSAADAATCPVGSLQVKDNVAATASVVYVDDGGGGGLCLPGIAIKNIPAVSQSGTWTFQPGNTPNTSPWLFTINQGGNSAAVKAASTAAATTDPAVVVQNAYEQAALGSPTDAPCPLPATSAGCTGIAIAKAGANAFNNSVPAGSNTIGNFNYTSQYPVGATPITASNTGTTGATTATLAGTTGKTTYICTSSVRANAAAAVTVTDTITGVVTATMSSTLWVAPSASGLGVDEQVFQPCVPASATNTGISVVSGPPGTGGVVSVHATGYQL